MWSLTDLQVRWKDSWTEHTSILRGTWTEHRFGVSSYSELKASVSSFMFHPVVQRNAASSVLIIALMMRSSSSLMKS